MGLNVGSTVYRLCPGLSEEKRQNKNKQRGCLLSPYCGGDAAGARSSVTAFDVPETMTLTQNSKPK